MGLKNLKIGTQLKVGFGIIIILFITSGVLSWFQNNELAQQTIKMYNHPLQVRRAVDIIEINILDISRQTKDVFLHPHNIIADKIIETVEKNRQNIKNQLEILYSQYLGPRSDIDQLRDELIKYDVMHNTNFDLIKQGKVELAKKRVISETGVTGIQSEKVLEKIVVINNYARNKADEFYSESLNIKRSVSTANLIFIISSLILAIAIITGLSRSIQKPLLLITRAINNFKYGEYNKRIDYKSKNEFGALSDGFNEMANTIENEFRMNKSSSKFASSLMKENDAHKFSQQLLTSLIELSSSEIGVLYLLNEKTDRFECFESIGLNLESCKSFSRKNHEGEIGLSLSMNKINHIKAVPEDVPFEFGSSVGTFNPNEIITIPVISDDSLQCFITLGTITNYEEDLYDLLVILQPMIVARMHGVMAYQKVRSFSKVLEIQNQELESQRLELSEKSEELMQQNKELEVQKRKLGEASKMKTTFLSNMSHELRTPLNSVIALSGVLNRSLKNKISSEEYEYIDVIERNGKHLLSLINDILDISRIEAGKDELIISEFNINTLVEEVITMIRPEATRKNVRINYESSADKLMVKSDYKKCTHILQNIIGNAVKYTEKGKVDISVKPRTETFDIIVKDTGIGISEEYLTKIFDQFSQGDSSTSRRFEGTGLGLAIAKKYGLMLGGDISVQSELDSGSTFIINLPIISDEVDDSFILNQIPDNVEAPAQVGDYTGKTILIVEDSEPAVIQIKEILEKDGFSLQVARNGLEAMECINEKVPDAMILDLMMPEMDGFEVLKEIRSKEETSKLPVIILTAKFITRDELKFLKYNQVRQLIQKGKVDRDQLLNILHDIIRLDDNIVKKETIDIKEKARNGSILLVEDNPDNMITMKALLSGRFEIYEATDGKMGVDKAKEHVPALIFMDIALPEVSGIEALKEIRKLPELSHIPIVAVTASALLEEREKLLSLGFDGYISKPIDHNMLEDYLNKYMT